jgi:outer membrane protein assembly factor BamB
MQVLGDVLAVQETGATVSVLETRSGERRWTDPVANPLTRFVGLNRDGKRLIVSSQSQAYFYDVDTGALLTKQNFEMVVNTRPVQVGEILVYGTATGQVLGHLMLNGFRQWGSTTRGPIEVDPVELGDSGVVALASRDGDLVILDGLTGTGRGRARIYDGPEAPLAASDDTVFVASLDHSLYAFGADGAQELWRIRTEAPLRKAPVYFNGTVCCDMGESGMTCYDARSGKQQWTNKSVHGTVIAVRNSRLVVWDGRTATTLDPVRGGTVDSVELKDVDLIRTDKFVDGNLYLASTAGVVTKLTPRK